MIAAHSIPAPVERLLRGAIDYAGLFPPAAESIADAIDGYARYHRSPDRWALGRLVVSASRLEELLAAVERSGRGPADDPWLVSATLGADQGSELELIGSLRTRAGQVGVTIDAVEAKVATPAAVRNAASRLPAGAVLYGEVPLGEGRDAVLEALGGVGAAAKIRMGGTTADLFPSAESVADFLVAVCRRSMPFKATAGLHHPLRGEFRLTYDPASARATMFGYLNLALAAALADRTPPATIREALLERDPRAIAITESALGWRDHRFALADCDRVRERWHGFGSCSFREPMDELRSLIGP